MAISFAASRSHLLWLFMFNSVTRSWRDTETVFVATTLPVEALLPGFGLPGRVLTNTVHVADTEGDNSVIHSQHLDPAIESRIDLVIDLAGEHGPHLTVPRFKAAALRFCQFTPSMKALTRDSITAKSFMEPTYAPVHFAFMYRYSA
jgi:hypothetical protein